MTTPTSIPDSRPIVEDLLTRSVSEAVNAANEQDHAVKVQAADSKFTVTIVALGVVVVFVIACIAWFWPHPPVVATKHSLNLSAPADMKVVPDVEPEPVAIAGVASISGNNDGRDNPDTAGAAMDGKPETSWRTATMRSSAMKGKGGYGLDINLGQTPVKVRKVVVTSSANGGVLQLRQTTAADPSGGVLLGSQPVTENTIFQLDQAVETNELVLWSTELPTAPGGGYRLIISELQILG